MKYNRMTPEIKKDLDNAFKFVIEDIGINVFNNFRNRLYPEYRSLLNTYAFRKHVLGPVAMSRYYIDNGLKMSHDKVKHSISKFDTYCYSLPELKNYLYKLFPESNKDFCKNKEVKTMVIDKRDLTPIQLLVNDLTEEQEKDLIELITIRKKSWEWKTQNNTKTYTSY